MHDEVPIDPNEQYNKILGMSLVVPHDWSLIPGTDQMLGKL